MVLAPLRAGNLRIQHIVMVMGLNMIGCSKTEAMRLMVKEVVEEDT